MTTYEVNAPWLDACYQVESTVEDNSYDGPADAAILVASSWDGENGLQMQSSGRVVCLLVNPSGARDTAPTAYSVRASGNRYVATRISSVICSKCSAPTAYCALSEGSQS